MATHSSTLAWKIPWTEESGRLQSMRSLRIGHNRATSLSLFHFHALEKEMATHCCVLAWRIPGTGEPGGLPSMGSHRVGHDWSDLAAAAAAVEGTMGLPWYLSSKDSACNAVDPGWIPVSRSSPVEGNGHPLQYSCLENSMDREAWQAVVHRVARLDTTEVTKQQQQEKELYP